MLFLLLSIISLSYAICCDTCDFDIKTIHFKGLLNVSQHKAFALETGHNQTQCATPLKLTYSLKFNNSYDTIFVLFTYNLGHEVHQQFCMENICQGTMLFKDISYYPVVMHVRVPETTLFSYDIQLKVNTTTNIPPIPSYQFNILYIALSGPLLITIVCALGIMLFKKYKKSDHL